MKIWKSLFILTLSATAVFCSESIKVGTFQQEVRTYFLVNDGLPANEVNAVAVGVADAAYVGTEKGLAVYVNKKWQIVSELAEHSITAIEIQGDKVFVLAKDKSSTLIYELMGKKIERQIQLPEKFSCTALLPSEKKLFLGSNSGIYAIELKSQAKPKLVGLEEYAIYQMTLTKSGKIIAATDRGLMKLDTKKKASKAIFPRSGNKSWAPVDVRAAFSDSKGRLWFASPQGVGCLDENWSLFTGTEGLPYDDFTAAAAGENGVVWFGTTKGAIRYDGSHWAYRQGKRWVADDHITDIAVNKNGDAWIATKKGLSLIERRAMTLAEKAKFYEDEIDRYHRRTPYEYVLEVGLPEAGVKKNVRKHDSDNDGLWTSMYGAGECFAYGATKDPLAKKRATKAFKAMEFLRKVTENAKHSPPKGFVARTILPTDGHNPNEGRIERDRENQKNRDKLWKVYEPRWPTSKDGKWYWKTDTSSDELDGHYFLYALYFDLVAKTEEEKAAVREQVKALTDHLIDHDFQLVDHDGKPTRWSRFSPKEVNFSKYWFVERGLNSLSMLSYLAIAEHVTGDAKYGKIKKDLIENHSYNQNLMRQKYHHGVGTGNQSDDEMAFMAYYHLLKYEKNPEWLSIYAMSLWDSWKIEEPEMNPFFNFIIAAVNPGLTYTDAYGTHAMDPSDGWLEDAIFTLKRIPLDRVNWRHDNSQRIDLVTLHPSNEGFDENSFVGKAYRSNGKVIPVDESYYNHYNHDVWRVQSGGNGHGLGDGTIFLLPYYMGLYHGFIK
ncbi:MAG: hypothetical protein DWQ05_17280 [Calditrichaeota bacterium]|nr:MAG: hypothetical protein DWQ05_17280 [Calditrichota bacterium]